MKCISRILLLLLQLQGEYFLKKTFLKRVVPLQNLLWAQLVYNYQHTYTNYTATYLPSRKLSKLNEPDMQDTAGEAGMNS